jgi:hypothetical protein
VDRHRRLRAARAGAAHRNPMASSDASGNVAVVQRPAW